MQTHSFSSSEVDRKWLVVDAADVPLGRLAARIAMVLRGKHRPTYSPNADTGDFVVVINAERVKLTGNKLDQKLYQTHSTIPGGLKEEPYRLLLKRRPEVAIQHAVHGMLPKTKLGRKLEKKLKVYSGPQHPHAAQKPEPLTV
ncbi:MAG: 50S ribosomal protein L13 [Sandaracinaceae bacterium]|nr:50S ribosomal protein L13 [Sandaracinaceae bacterium]